MITASYFENSVGVARKKTRIREKRGRRGRPSRTWLRQTGYPGLPSRAIFVACLGHAWTLREWQTSFIGVNPNSALRDHGMSWDLAQ